MNDDWPAEAIAADARAKARCDGEAKDPGPTRRAPAPTLDLEVERTHSSAKVSARIPLVDDRDLVEVGVGAFNGALITALAPGVVIGAMFPRPRNPLAELLRALTP